MALATPEIPVPQQVYGHHHQLETPELTEPGMMAMNGGKGDQNSNYKDENIPVEAKGEQTETGVVYMQSAEKHARDVTGYMRRKSKHSTSHPCVDFDEFKSSIEGLSSTAALYVLVDEDFFRLQETHYVAFKKVLTETAQSNKTLLFVNYLESEKRFQEVYYKLPEEIRNNFIPREKFLDLTNGLVNITENDDTVIQTGQNNELEVSADTGDLHGTQIGRNNAFKYTSGASVTGYVLTIKTPETNQQLDVSIKRHIDDNKDHINITLKDLQAKVISTELGSVIIQVAVEEGAKIGPEWLRELITRILPEDIISSLPPGTRMEVNIKASLPLKPLDVNIFYSQEEGKVSRNGKKQIMQDLVELANFSTIEPEPGSSVLHLAVTFGRRLVVQELLSAGVDSNQRTRYNNTPLHKAAESGNANIVDLLVQKGADVHAENCDLDTPLHLAAVKNNTECIERLLLADISNSHANVDDPDDKQVDPMLLPNTPASKIAIMLLNAKANTYARDYSQNTPLHTAAMAGNVEIVDTLVSYGADLNSLNSENETPLHIALSKGNLRCAIKLVSNDALILTDKYGNTPIHVMRIPKNISSKHPPIFQGFHGRFGSSPLHSAVGHGNIDAISALIRLGQDVNAVDKQKLTPLHIISSKTEMQDESPEEKQKVYIGYILKQFLAVKGNINARNIKGDTALHNAVLLENGSLALDLISHGADASIANVRRETIFHTIATAMKKSSSLIKVIQRYGGNINAVNRKGETPLDVARNHGNDWCIEALRQVGAVEGHLLKARTSKRSFGIGMDDDEYESSVLVHSLRDFSAQMKTHGQGSLHAAAHDGDLGRMIILLHQGADINARNVANDTALHILATTYGKGRYEPMRSQVVDLSELDLKGSLDAKNARGETPKQVAVEVENMKAVDLFKDIEKLQKKDMKKGFLKILDAPDVRNECLPFTSLHMHEIPFISENLQKSDYNT